MALPSTSSGIPNSIKDLTVKQLVAVLTHLKQGSIGFDVYRDDRTSTKSKILSYILMNFENNAIITAISAVTLAPSTQNNQVIVRLKYRTISSNDDYFQDFRASTEQEAYAEAHKFLQENPSNRSLGITSITAAYQALNKPDDLYTDALKYAKPSINLNEGLTYAAIGTKESKPKQDPRLKALEVLLGNQEIDEKKVKEICDARAQDYVDNILSAVNKRLDSFNTPTVIHIKDSHDVLQPVIDLGLNHKCFPSLLKAAQARTLDGNRLNIWLAGPAGSGKTTAAKKVSEALSLAFQFNGAISTEYELMGFKDAHGTYHRTAFREIFEHGGVYLFDEVDSSMPKAVLAFNAALANGECRFPDGMIKRHTDAVIIAGANTLGDGATSDYIGRMKQDKAFLDRFVPIAWPLDESLETALASNKKWAKKVQSMRSKVKKRCIKGHLISPRATFYGEALLNAGWSENEVITSLLKRSLTDDTWSQIAPESIPDSNSDELPF